MTTATIQERTTFQSPEGYDLVIVQEHNRALPGQAGSDWKPVLVREHLRRLMGGKEVAYKTTWKWAAGELSAALVEAMADVTGLAKNMPPKNYGWTMKAATAVLTYGMRWDNGWTWKGYVDGSYYSVVNSSPSQIEALLKGKSFKALAK